MLVAKLKSRDITVSGQAGARDQAVPWVRPKNGIADELVTLIADTRSAAVFGQRDDITRADHV